MYAKRGRKRGWEANACKYGERVVGKQTCANRGRKWGSKETYANTERVSKGGVGAERTYAKQGGWMWGGGYLFVCLFVKFIERRYNGYNVASRRN